MQVLVRNPGWVVYNSATDGNATLDGSVLILATEAGLHRISTSETLISDGTFRKAPKLYAQQVHGGKG